MASRGHGQSSLAKPLAVSRNGRASWAPPWLGSNHGRVADGLKNKPVQACVGIHFSAHCETRPGIWKPLGFHGASRLGRVVRKGCEHWKKPPALFGVDSGGIKVNFTSYHRFWGLVPRMMELPGSLRSLCLPVGIRGRIRPFPMAISNPLIKIWSLGGIFQGRSAKLTGRLNRHPPPAESKHGATGPMPSRKLRFLGKNWRPHAAKRHTPKAKYL